MYKLAMHLVMNTHQVPPGLLHSRLSLPLCPVSVTGEVPARPIAVTVPGVQTHPTKVVTTLRGGVNCKTTLNTLRACPIIKIR